MKRLLLLIIVGLLMDSVSQGQIPVILRVAAEEQSDTTGCNFVNELARISYAAIMNGEAKLWNSPSKEILIIPQTLKEIEKSSGTRFVDQSIIFIYEYWSNTNKILSSKTTGFLFSNKSAGGSDIEYGYVEFDALQPYFQSERVMSNANGNYNANLAAYVASKNYNYNFLQFAGKVITNREDSRKIKEEYIGSNKFNLSQFASREIPQKKVIWTLDLSTDNVKLKSQNGNKLLAGIEKYLRSNEELFYNLGGDKILNHVQKGKWKVTRIEMSELWKKVDGVISADPIGMTIFINDSSLSEILYRDLIKMDVIVNEQPLLVFLKQLNFNYIIRSINSQEIPRSESYAYQKAIFESDWKRLTDYVSRF